MKKYDIAAYIWPAYTGKEPRTRMFWPDGIGEWQTTKLPHVYPEHNYVWDRKPLWGYQDEADPKVMEMQIREALRHGVNVFIYDWYWFDNRPFLEQCLNEGFLKAENCNDMKFYIMWANHDANYTWDYRNSSFVDSTIWEGTTTEKQFRIIGKRWLEQYFCRENYYKIDGKPVVSIYDLSNFIATFGGVENTAKNIQWLKEEAKKYGLPGVHLQLIKWGEQPINLSGVDGGEQQLDSDLVNALGFDSMTHYQMVHFIADVSRDYRELIPEVTAEWDRAEQNFDIPYYPHASIGWDNNPRFQEFRPAVVENNTPTNFKKMLELAKAFSDAHNAVPLITVNSWNEWTETSYLLPDNVNGYGYLEAIRDVFGAQQE